MVQVNKWTNGNNRCLYIYYFRRTSSGFNLKTYYINNYLDCTCIDYIDEDGYGMCQKADEIFGGLFSCYVNQPSSCLDLEAMSNEKQLSAEACKDANTGKLYFYKFNTYITQNEIRIKNWNLNYP